MKIQYWKAGPEHADDLMAIIRHRMNIRASQSNRRNFPKLGHYDHWLIDYILADTQKIFGSLLFGWWKNTTLSRKSRETFGIIPCVQSNEQLDLTLLNTYTRSMRFLAIRMNSMASPVARRDGFVQ